MQFSFFLSVSTDKPYRLCKYYRGTSFRNRLTQHTDESPRLEPTLCHFGRAGTGGLAVARLGRQRAAATDAERPQIHSDRRRLLLQMGGGRAHAVLPSFRCGEERCRYDRLLWIPFQNPVQTSSWHRAQSECFIYTTSADFNTCFCWHQSRIEALEQGASSAN